MLPVACAAARVWQPPQPALAKTRSPEDALADEPDEPDEPEDVALCEDEPDDVALCEDEPEDVALCEDEPEDVALCADERCEVELCEEGVDDDPPHAARLSVTAAASSAAEACHRTP
jgi:hypothetical protein